ncbi:hypothetical protein D3C76_1657600 [compost metagenome]
MPTRLAAADGVDHFDAVAFAQGGGGVQAARHYVEVEFDRDAAASQIQAGNEVRDSLAVGKLEGFTVQLNAHDGTVTTGKGTAF